MKKRLVSSWTFSYSEVKDIVNQILVIIVMYFEN
jgi:hypothetical protein